MQDWATIGFDLHGNALCSACGTPANPVGTDGEPGSYIDAAGCLHYRGSRPAAVRCRGCGKGLAFSSAVGKGEVTHGPDG